jgi:hypothetical protein
MAYEFPTQHLSVQRLDKESSRDERVSIFRHLPDWAVRELNRFMLIDPLIENSMLSYHLVSVSEDVYEAW